MVLSARIGAIEFAGDEVRLAIVKTGGRRPQVLELHECAAQYTEPEQRAEALAQAVREVTRRARKRPTVYTLCVASTHGVVRTLSVPFKGRRKVSAAVPFELERYLAFPIDEFVVDYFPVLEIEKDTEVLAVGVRRNALREQLDILAAAGIDPQGVNVDAIGLTGLWRACHGGMKGLHAVLHVRDGHSCLAITSNKAMVYYRHLPFGATAVREKTAIVVQEIQNSLRAFHAAWRGGGEVLSLTVTGMGVMPPSRDVFEKDFDIPVSYEEILDRLKTGAGKNAIGQHGNRWEAAIGVALGGAGGGYGMNFRKEEFAPKNVLAGMMPHFLLAAILLMVLFAGIVQYYRGGRARLLAEAAELRDQIAGLETEVAELQKQGINMEGASFAEPNLLDILQEIGAKMPDDKVRVSQIKIEPAAVGAPWVIIEGEVKEDAAFTAAFAELRKSTLFNVDEDPSLELVKGKSTFRIIGRKPEPSAAEMPAEAPPAADAAPAAGVPPAETPPPADAPPAPEAPAPVEQPAPAGDKS